MKQALTSNQATFNPQNFKNFAGALDAFLHRECPHLGGSRIRQVLVASINQMVLDFYPETSHLQPGQTPWVTVDKDEKSSYGKRISDTKLTNVVLDIVQPCDAADRANGKKLKDVKQEAVARLFTQAFEQGGCMTQAEVAVLLKLSASTVGKYLKSWELDHDCVIPTRGSIHDIGPTLTHKKIIIHKLFIDQKPVQQVCRETYHSPEAVLRYISTFKKVLLCRKNNFTPEETAYSINHSVRLVHEYLRIIDVYQNQGNILEKLLAFEAKIEEPDPYYH